MPTTYMASKSLSRTICWYRMPCAGEWERTVLCCYVLLEVFATSCFWKQNASPEKYLLFLFGLFFFSHYYAILYMEERPAS